MKKFQKREKLRFSKSELILMKTSTSFEVRFHLAQNIQKNQYNMKPTWRYRKQKYTFFSSRVSHQDHPNST